MAWDLFFRISYRLIRLGDPIVRWFWRRRLPLLGRIVEVRVAGRRSGRQRSTLVTLLSVGGAWYAGHPNGAADWTSNVEAAGGAEIVLVDGARRTVAASGVSGPEREALIRATGVQQPFPANVVYRLARRHIERAGVYLRLTPLDEDAAPSRPGDGS